MYSGLESNVKENKLGFSLTKMKRDRERQREMPRAYKVQSVTLIILAANLNKNHRVYILTPSK